MSDQRRKAVDVAIGAVLFNVANFPDNVQTRLLGQDMGPLRAKLTDAVMGALAKVEPVQIDREALLSHAERVSGALEEYEFEGIAAEAPAVMNALIDALAAQPVTGTVETVEWFRFQYGPDSFSVAYPGLEALRAATNPQLHGFPISKRTVKTTTETTEWQEVTDE